MKNNYSIIKRLLIICICVVCCFCVRTNVNAEVNATMSTYITGVLTDGYGDQYTYYVTIGGSISNGVHTIASTEAKTKRTHYAVNATFRQNGLNVYSTTSTSALAALKGTSYSPYSRPGSLSGITAILAGSGSVWLQYAGTKYVSF